MINIKINDISIAGLLANIDKQFMEYNIKTMHNLIVFTKYSNGDVRQISYVKLNESYDKDYVGDDEDILFVNKLISVSKFNISKLIINHFSLRINFDKKQIDTFTSRVRIGVLTDIAKKTIDYIELECPSSNINTIIKPGYHELNSGFEDLIHVCKIIKDDYAYINEQWSYYTEDPNLKYFDVKIDADTNIKIDNLITRDYPYITHELSDKNELRINRHRHAIYTDVRNNEIKHRLIVESYFPDIVIGNVYMDYSCKSFISQYLFFINKLNGNKTDGNSTT